MKSNKKEIKKPGDYRLEITRKKIATLLPKIMKREKVDIWLIFTREESSDPLAKDFAAGSMVARTALIFSLQGKRIKAIAIAASYDITRLQESGLYSEVISYKQEGIKPHLLKVIKELKPRRIALNFSRDIPIADGLSKGMRNYLSEVWGEDYDRRVVSAQPIILSFRSVKLPEEIEIIKEAVKITEKIIDSALSTRAIKPGRTTEKDLGKYMEKLTKAAGAEIDFISINVGPTRGHADPTDLVIRRGDLVRIDFGIRYKHYTTDIQRSAYILKKGEKEAPHEIRKMFAITKLANEAAINALKPGATGLEVDSAARNILLANGYEEYPHGTGHPIGFSVHDVGPMLGPDWKERYGSAVHARIEESQVFAVEPMIYMQYEPCGGVIHLGLEEDVVVTDTGAEHLSHPPQKLKLL